MKRRLSEATERLIEQLYARAGIWNRFVYTDKPEEILQKIRDAGEPEAIPDLLPLLITGDKRTIKASAEAIHCLLQRLKPAEFANFDAFVRLGCADWRPRREPWYKMKQNDVGQIAKIGVESVSLLGIASFHASGYVREEATRQLGKIETGAELPFLFVRANDWVEPVRALAHGLVMKRMRPNYLAHFLTWLPLALRLGEAKRTDYSTVLGGMRRLFERPEAREALEAGFASEDKFTRRFCFDVALRSDVAGVEWTIKKAFETRDLEVRKAAVAKLGQLLPNDELNGLLGLPRRDASAAVREAALEIYRDKFPGQAADEFEHALLDANTWVRAMAQQYFSKAGTVDVRDYYVRNLGESRNSVLVKAIAGLGETGVAQDAKSLDGFFANTSSRVRAAALHAVARLDPHSRIEAFVSALEDASASVAREGLLALLRKANIVGGTRLWQIYERSQALHSKRFVMYLVARLNKWDSIVYLILSLGETDERLVELSKRYIARWFARYNKSFVTPSAEQFKALRDVLAERSLLVSAEMERELGAIVKSFG